MAYGLLYGSRPIAPSCPCIVKAAPSHSPSPIRYVLRCRQRLRPEPPEETRRYLAPAAAIYQAARAPFRTTRPVTCLAMLQLKLQ